MKLIFLDIDGTLTRPGENNPPPSAIKAIKQARSNGHKVFLCTGRNPDMLAPVFKLGFDGMISCAGGYVAVGEDASEVLFDYPMNNYQRDLALTSLHKHGVFCTIEAKNGSWGDENLDAFLKNQTSANSEIERWRKALSENLGIRSMSEYDGSPIYKVVIMCESMQQLDEAKSLLGDDFNFVLQEVKAHSCINGEILNKNFNKGSGVKLIAKRFDTDLKNTIGFGDSMNDLEMIQTVGLSVCMANGSETLKESADIICPSVDDDGIAKAFADLKLI